MDFAEEGTDRYLPAMGISSGLHLVALIALACAAWGRTSAAPDTTLVPIPAQDLSALLVHMPDKKDLPAAERKEPEVDLKDATPPDLTGIDGDKNLKNDPSLMPLDFKPADRDETVGGNTPGEIGGDTHSKDLEAGLLFVDGVDRGRFKVHPGNSSTGTGNEARNPFGPRKGKGGLQNTRVGDPYRAGAIARALSWLERHQESTGAWTSSFDRRCRDGRCSGPGESQHDTGLTALAALAFLAQGNSPARGRHAPALRRAVDWLRKQQDASGRVGPPDCEKALYNHALAAMALVEASGTLDFENAHDPALAMDASKAVAWLVSAQNAGAGWRYRNYNAAGAAAEEGGNNDTSVTGWCVMALKDARTAGFEVPDSAFQGASAWLDRAQAEDPANYQVTYGYTKANAFVHHSTQTTTAVGLLCRELMGQPKSVPQAAGLVMEHLPSRPTMNLYYWYYGTLAMFQAGGKEWREWFPALKKTLLDSQARSGCEQGSWEPADDPWGAEGGRVYMTAMGALCLESVERYYRVESGGK